MLQTAAFASCSLGRDSPNNPSLARAEPGKQNPRSCRTQELARSSGPRKGAAEKGWLPDSTNNRRERENRRQCLRRKKNRGSVSSDGAHWKNCVGASEARPGMVSRQSTGYPDGEQRDSTCVTTVPPNWPMTAWATACGDYFRVTTRKLARPLNTSASDKALTFLGTYLVRLPTTGLLARIASG